MSNNSTNNTMDLSVMEKVIIQGDLSVLNPNERLIYYTKVCESMGLNPITRPFEYLSLGKGNDKKMILYAKRECTEQLRKIHKVKVNIISRERVGDAYCVTARATLPDGREDESIGAVSLVKDEVVWDEKKQKYIPTGNIIPLNHKEFINALMACETKAKRRVTLSIVGLGMMDESELESVEGAERVEVGEGTTIKDNPKKLPSKQDSNIPNSQLQNNTEDKSKKNDINKDFAKNKQQDSERYKMLDMEIKTSGNSTLGKLRVINLATGEQEYVIAKGPEALEQVTELNNEDCFEFDYELNGKIKIVTSIRVIEGEVA